MRRFTLRRSKDPSGVSGLGIVAEGIEFSDGRCVISWLTERSSIGIYDDAETLLAIHGHDHATEIQWYDPISVQVK